MLGSIKKSPGTIRIAVTYIRAVTMQSVIYIAGVRNTGFTGTVLDPKGRHQSQAALHCEQLVRHQTDCDSNKSNNSPLTFAT